MTRLPNGRFVHEHAGMIVGVFGDRARDGFMIENDVPGAKPQFRFPDDGSDVPNLEPGLYMSVQAVAPHRPSMMDPFYLEVRHLVVCADKEDTEVVATYGTPADPLQGPDAWRLRT